MEPDNGVNAAVLLASFLNRIFKEGPSKDFTQFMFDASAMNQGTVPRVGVQ